MKTKKIIAIAEGPYLLYFDSKDEVLLSLVTDFAEEDENAAAADGFYAGDDALGRIQSMVNDLPDQGKSRLRIVPIFWEVAGNRMVQSKYDLNRKIDVVLSKMAGMPAGAIERGRQEGSISADPDAGFVSRMLINAIDGIILHAAIFGNDSEAFLESHRTELIAIVRSYLSPRAPGARKTQENHP